MRTAVITLAALTIIGLGLVGTAFIVFDEDRLRGLISARLAEMSGYDIEIRGAVELSFFPGVRLRAEQVRFQHPGESDLESLPLAFERLDMNVRLLPLLRGSVQPLEVSIDRARVELRDGSDLRSLVAMGNNPEVAGPIGMPVVNLSAVEVFFAEALERSARVVSIEEVRFHRLHGDRALSFGFVGNVGDPPVFDGVEVEGLAAVSDSGVLRLSNMAASVHLPEPRGTVELMGHLAFDPGPDPQLWLDDGRLRIGGQELAIGLGYQAGERGLLDLSLESELFDVDVLALPERIDELLFQDTPDLLAAALGGLDFDVVVAIDQVARLGLVLEALRVEMTGRGGEVSIDRVESIVPGGYLTVNGALDARGVPMSGRFDIAVEAERFSELLSAMRVEQPPGGAGRVELSLEVNSSLESESAGRIRGEGEFALWQGSWPLLSALRPDNATAAGLPEAFDSAGGRLVINDSSLAVGDLAISYPEHEVSGDVIFSLPGLELGGHLILDNDSSSRFFSLGGSQAMPRAELLPTPE